MADGSRGIQPASALDLSNLSWNGSSAAAVKQTQASNHSIANDVLSP
jgi:hypothetical protein